MSEKFGLSPRLLAFHALKDWKAGKGFLSDLIRQHGKKEDEKDRAVAIEIAHGVCRNLTLLEHNLRRFVKFLPKGHARWVLFIGAYQMYQDKRFEAHTAVNLTVEVAKKVLSRKEVPMVNGVLRSMGREKFDVPRHSKKLKNVAIAYSHPGWMIHRWNEELGFNKTIRRLRHNNSEPVHWVRLAPKKISQEEINKEFGEDLEWRFERYFQLNSPLREFLKHPMFLEGKLSLQDPSSWLMTRLLDLKGEETVLDLCSAPGGKTALLLEEFENLKVISSELKPGRLKSLKDVENRLRLSTQLLCMDGRTPALKEESFSHILLDAPCSNLGVLSRRVEARWLEGVKEIHKQAELQKELLEKAISLLKPGGVLVYGTCSPEPEETYQLIETFLEEHPELEVESARKYIHRNHCYSKYLRIIPQPGSMDGFFGVRLCKKAD